MRKIRIKYNDYKNNEVFCNCYQVKDSYDSKDKTIEIFVNELLYLKFITGEFDKKNEQVNKHKIEYIETVVLYKDYKKLYESKGYRTKNYNDKNGTIVVYLPKDVTYERSEKDKHYEDRNAFKKGYVDEVTIVPEILNIDDFVVEVPECLKN